jgi:hypothetical protein
MRVRFGLFGLFTYQSFSLNFPGTISNTVVGCFSVVDVLLFLSSLTTFALGALGAALLLIFHFGFFPPGFSRPISALAIRITVNTYRSIGSFSVYSRLNQKRKLTLKQHGYHWIRKSLTLPPQKKGTTNMLFNVLQTNLFLITPSLNKCQNKNPHLRLHEVFIRFYSN